jgi:hypothetical protein
MDKQVQQLLKDKDFQRALEILKPDDENAGLVLADYLNEKKMWEHKYISDEAWQAYNGEVLMRVKQLCQEVEERQAQEMNEGKKANEKTVDKQAMPKVFISYSNKDSHIVKKVTDYLQENHYDYFVDVITMIPGEVIETTITREIIERDYFVILLSRNSLRSPWVCLESVVSKAKETCGYGWAVPVRVDDCLEDWNFMVDVQEHIRANIAEMDKHIERSRKYSSDHKFIDTERQRQVEFGNNYSSMIDRYRNIAGINIAGDLFEEGMKKLMATIQKVR